MAGNRKFPRMLEHIRIGRVEFRNRIVKPGQVTCFADKDGYVTERMKAFYEAIARGGVGMLIVEATAIDYPQGMSGLLRLLNSDDKFVPGLTELVEVIHKHGCPTFLQLQHGGPGTPRVFGIQPVAASSLGDGERPIPGFALSRELTVPEIGEIVAKFAAAAQRAQKAGFDGVEIHAAHMYLLNSFLSRAWNKRQDEYGCRDLSTRSRIAVEVIQAVKTRLGQDFPVGIRINGAEYGLEKGLTPQETQGIARLLEKAGADYIHVSVFGYGDYDFLIQPEQILYPEPAKAIRGVARLVKKPGALVHLAEAIKREVSVPVIAVGRLDPRMGEWVLKHGQADLIAMGRPLMADPELPNKIAAGREDEVRPCVYCLTCLSRTQARKPMLCRTNAALAKEREYAIRPAELKKKVMVVGGGPAGMEAARVAALRGHEVTLFEKERRLGGLLPLAALVKGVEIEDFPALVRYLKIEMDRLGVKVRIGTEVDPALVEKMKPDVVVLATGGVPGALQIPGADRANVIASSSLDRKAKILLRVLGLRPLRWLTRFWLPIGRKVVIVGGLMQGCQRAEFLVKRGRRVTVVEASDQLGTGIPEFNRPRLISWMQRKGVAMLTEVKYEEITDKGLVVTTKDGNRQTLVADTILVDTPLVASNGLMQTLQGIVPEVYSIGDARKPRLIIDAMDDGWRTGNTI